MIGSLGVVQGTSYASPASANWVDLVTMIATCVAALSVVFVWRQIRADHERSRREQALELMKFWTSQNNYDEPFFVFGRNLLMTLNREQSEKVYGCLEFSVDNDQLELLKIFRKSIKNRLHGADEVHTEEQKNGHSLTKTESRALRMVATTFLNRLEVVATAWCSGITDKSMIEEEFKIIIAPKTGKFIMEDILSFSPVYPSLKAIIDHMKSSTNGKPNKRPVA